jgi:hypothetical protein
MCTTCCNSRNSAFCAQFFYVFRDILRIISDFFSYPYLIDFSLLRTWNAFGIELILKSVLKKLKNFAVFTYVITITADWFLERWRLEQTVPWFSHEGLLSLVGISNVHCLNHRGKWRISRVWLKLHTTLHLNWRCPSTSKMDCLNSWTVPENK